MTNIMDEKFEFLTSIETNSRTVYSHMHGQGVQVQYEQEEELLELYEGSNCVTVTREDVQKLAAYFDTVPKLKIW